MGNASIKKENIENRIIEYLKTGWDDMPKHLKIEIEKEIRKTIRDIINDEFENLVLY